tara:strand:+ start:3699 stop:4583 length:885 start_codon:yes stop_codon:yes gene_type:complete
LSQKSVILFFNNLRGLEVLNYLLKKKDIKILKIILAEKYLNKEILKKIKNKIKKINIHILNKNKLNSKNKIFNIKTDLFILCGFPYILKKELFNIPKFGTLNLHAGPLPNYRGGSPLNWQIINGERKIGLSIIKINTKIDGGSLINQKFFKLKKNQDIKDVHKIANKIFPEMLYRSIRKITCFKKPFIKKNNYLSKYYKQRTYKDGQIFWRKFDNKRIYNLVRAITTPYPGAFTYNSERKKIIILKVSISKKKLSQLKLGQVLKNNNHIFIKTRNGTIQVNRKIGKFRNLEILK